MKILREIIHYVDNNYRKNPSRQPMPKSVKEEWIVTILVFVVSFLIGYYGNS